VHSNKLLRKQVASEIKKRDYVVFTILLLTLIYLSTAFFFNDKSLLSYFDLGKKETALQSEVDTIRQENEKLKAIIESSSENDFYLEKHARENFGLAEPDEYIYRYEK
jgi:cell division protein FtsB